MIQATYDKTADAFYVKLSDKPFVKNKKINNNTILDLDSEDKIIGVEFLDASKQLSKDVLEQNLSK